jgi:uncharacterized membrane protein
MIPYPAAIAIHLIAVMLFLGGLFIAALVLKTGPSASELARMRRWNRIATTPALLMLWAAGLFLAVEGEWLGAIWLQLKLACVVALTLIHALQSRRLGAAGPVVGTAWILPVSALLVVLIFCLVGAKPG